MLLRLLHGTDVRADGPELGHDVLIAPLDILHIADLAPALGRQGRDDQSGAGPQVVGLNGRAGEMVHALHHGGLVVHLDVGAYKQAVELDMLSGIIADSFQFSEEDLRRRRAESVRNVKQTNGRISFEKRVRDSWEDDDGWQD